MIVIGIIRDFNNYHVVLQNFNLWHGSLEFIIYSKHNSVQKEKLFFMAPSFVCLNV